MQSKRITSACNQCGGTVTSWPSKRKKFCSRICASTARRFTPALFWSNVDRTDIDGCWPWTRGTDKDGYGKTSTLGQDVRAHQQAYIYTHGGIPKDKPCVCHKCNNRLCCRPDHLYADTNVGNTAYRVQSGRSASGDAHWTHRFPERLTRGDDHWTRRRHRDATQSRQAER